MCQLYDRFVKLCKGEWRMCVDCLRENRNRQFYYLFLCVLVTICLAITSYNPYTYHYRTDGSTQFYFLMALISLVVYAFFTSVWTISLILVRCLAAVLHYGSACKLKEDPESCANIEMELCNFCNQKKYLVNKENELEDVKAHCWIIGFLFTIENFTVKPMGVVIARLEKMQDVKELFIHREAIVSSIQYAWSVIFWVVCGVFIAQMLRTYYNRGKKCSEGKQSLGGEGQHRR